MLARKRLAVLGFICVSTITAALSLALFSGSQLHQVEAQADCQTFPETGFKVCGKFLSYWNTHGGLAQQGFPISDVFEEKNADPPAGDGKVHKVQYFQRARFEEHLENQPPYDTLLGLLGGEQLKAKYGQVDPKAQLLTIMGKRTQDKIENESPKSGFIFLIVDVQLTNVTGKDISSNVTDFTVKTEQGFEYSVDSNTYLLPKGMKLNKVTPNDSVRAELAFQVPTSETPKSITFYDFTNKVTVNL